METGHRIRRAIPTALLTAGLLGTAVGGTVLLRGVPDRTAASSPPASSSAADHSAPSHSAADHSAPDHSAQAPSATGRSTAPPGDLTSRVRALLARMSLEDKVGQLFVSRVYGGDAERPSPAEAAENRRTLGVDSAAEAIARYRLGGVVYFGWAGNLGTPRRTAELSAALQRAAHRLPVPVPLLIATDQEQGAVVRVGPPATGFPGAMALGASGRAADARSAARITGTELAALGINQDYAPVADVNVNPTNPVIGVRSFGADPTAVATLTAAQVDGFREAGTVSTAKHFPGHGDTATDSHTGLPVITHSRAVWERVDAPPFAAAVRHGVDTVMTAHIAVPALDPSGTPATLSRPILTGLLREHLGYDGVVITDSLDMAGVRQRYGDDRVPVLALRAGADQLLNPPDLALAYRSVLAAVRDGELTQARIDTSVARVLRLKVGRGLFERQPVDPTRVAQRLGTAAHLAAADAVADHSVTVLRDAGHALPLAAATAGQRVLVTGWETADDSSAGVGTTGGHPVRELAAALDALGHPARALPTGPIPDTEAVLRAAAAAGNGRSPVVVLTHGVSTDPAQQRLVGALLATGRPVLQIAVGNPYDLAWLPGVRTALATYSWSAVSMQAAARILAGRTVATGRLPVPLPDARNPASVLLPLGFGLPG